MKEKELREKAMCGVCKKSFGHCGSFNFYRVRVENWIIDGRAIQRQSGLAMFLGGHGVLAEVMGPNEDMAKLYGHKEITVCAECMPNLYAIDALGCSDGEGENVEMRVKPLEEAKDEES